MKIVICGLYILPFFIIAIISSCSKTEEQKQPVQTVNGKDTFSDYTVKETYDFMVNNQNNLNIVLLDVRTKNEYDVVHLKDSRLIDFYQPNFKQQLGTLDKNRTYIVYCRTENRSGQTIAMMKELGFREAHTVIGGMVEWNAQNLPLDFSK